MQRYAILCFVAAIIGCNGLAGLDDLTYKDAEPPESGDPTVVPVTSGGLDDVGGPTPSGEGGAGEGGAASVPPDMVQVAEGAFPMGCDETVDDRCDTDEHPRHDVTLSTFWIEKYEVTQEAYELCVGAGACSWPSCDHDPTNRPQHPVVCVTRAQAAEYCAWRGRDLPTEAQWEKAARGTESPVYPWGDTPPNCSRGNFGGCGIDTAEVGSYGVGASPYGAFDMAGNVAEWVRDDYDADFYAASPGQDPAGPAPTLEGIARGGSFISSADDVRASDRDKASIFIPASYLGFRCVEETPN